MWRSLTVVVAPVCGQVRVLGESSTPDDEEDNVLPDDPHSPAALERQAHFLKTAVARLLGGEAPATSVARSLGSGT